MSYGEAIDAPPPTYTERDGDNDFPTLTDKDDTDHHAQHEYDADHECRTRLCTHNGSSIMPMHIRVRCGCRLRRLTAPFESTNPVLMSGEKPTLLHSHHAQSASGYAALNPLDDEEEDAAHTVWCTACNAFCYVCPLSKATPCNSTLNLARSRAQRLVHSIIGFILQHLGCR